jgi:hypothetical protein
MTLTCGTGPHRATIAAAMSTVGTSSLAITALAAALRLATSWFGLAAGGSVIFQKRRFQSERASKPLQSYASLSALRVESARNGRLARG